MGGSCWTVNSREVQSRLDPELKRRGVVFGSLDTLAAEHESLVRSALFRRRAWMRLHSLRRVALASPVSQ